MRRRSENCGISKDCEDNKFTSGLEFWKGYVLRIGGEMKFFMKIVQVIISECTLECVKYWMK